MHVVRVCVDVHVWMGGCGWSSAVVVPTDVVALCIGLLVYWSDVRCGKGVGVEIFRV